MIRFATAADLDGIEAIYDAILTREEAGPVYTNWQRGKYPTRAHAQQALDAGLSVCTLGRRILRCETAPLCALSAVMYDSGEF